MLNEVKHLRRRGMLHFVQHDKRLPPLLSTINHQPSTINHQPSTINHQPSTINHQPSTINHQPSTINHQ
ncbi:MAG: hypothetical protein ABFE08_24430, partial [Armatimonadia bacterium]